MIINLGCASVDNHIPRDDIFDYHPRRECNIYIILFEKRLVRVRIVWFVQYSGQYGARFWVWFFLFVILLGLDLLGITSRF